MKLQAQILRVRAQILLKLHAEKITKAKESHLESSYMNCFLHGRNLKTITPPKTDADVAQILLDSYDDKKQPPKATKQALW